jgi:hypothetical protein
LKLRDKHWSEGVAKQAVKYSGKLPFEEATEALNELAQIEISVNSVWRLVRHWGEALKVVEAKEAKQANRSVDGIATGRVEQRTDRRLGAAMDGTMIYIRGEEWKELKVGCLFDVEPELTLETETQDWIELGHAHHTTYVSHLGGPETFGEKMWTEAKRRGWQQAADTQVVGDAATWIWNLVGTYFYDAQQVIDWYHASEHLAQAAHLAFGEGTPEAVHWFKEQETPLFQGHADRVAQTITNLADHKPNHQELLKQAGYFSNNQHRMQYLEMRSEGWLIGSGMVESGGKRFKDRFTCSGMRWSRAGAERLLPVRTAIMSGCFDTRWRIAYNSPQN